MYMDEQAAVTHDDRFDFVAQILSAEPLSHEGVIEFRHLLQEDMRVLLSDADVPSAVVAQVLYRLHAVADRMELMTNSPCVLDKCVVAVAGGFSSGKSSFISSFMDGAAIKLPVGIDPMTSIPTYVVSGPRGTIQGYTDKGGVIDIPLDLYARLSHRFVHSLGFNLRDILPFAAIETPLRDLEHVTFIDLPGYDPAMSEGAYTDDDSTVALEFLAQAHALIWVIGLDVNGTIPSSDLDFLGSLQSENAQGNPLYIVLNKADLRPPADLTPVLDNVQALLNAEGIAYSGLCTYSSARSTQFRYRGQHLKTFLREIDQPTNGRADLLKELNATFRRLYDAMSKNSQKSEELENAVIALELDLHELGLYRARRTVSMEQGRGRRRPRTPAEVAQSAQERLAYLKEQLRTLEVDGALGTAKRIAQAMRMALKTV